MRGVVCGHMGRSYEVSGSICRNNNKRDVGCNGGGMYGPVGHAQSRAVFCGFDVVGGVIQEVGTRETGLSV